MKTTQEIFTRHLEEWFGKNKMVNNVPNEVIYSAMKEYASDLLIDFVEWQKKYKDSSYVDIFNVTEYLKLAAQKNQITKCQ